MTTFAIATYVTDNICSSLFPPMEREREEKVLYKGRGEPTWK